LVRALEVSLDEILAEGLAARYQRHRRVAEYLRRGMIDLGFEIVTEASARAPTLSVLRPPPGLDEGAVRAGMLVAGVLVAGGIGPLAGVAIRVGHMGTATENEADQVIAAAALATR